MPGTVFVTVGTTKFDALIEAVDTAAVADALAARGYDRSSCRWAAARRSPIPPPQMPPSAPPAAEATAERVALGRCARAAATGSARTRRGAAICESVFDRGLRLDPHGKMVQKTLSTALRRTRCPIDSSRTLRPAAISSARAP